MRLKPIVISFLLTSLTLFAEVGEASWYGKKFQGKPTASGEPFNMYAYTAAHRTLPFGTMLTVTNLDNNKSVKVKITDRGPFKKSRIVDLSYQAAKEIGLLKAGVASVEIQTYEKKKSLKKSIPNDKTTSSIYSNPYLSHANPYLTDDEYKYKQVKYNQYLPSNVPSGNYSYKAKTSKEQSAKIKLQVASFSSHVNAKKFIEKERDKKYKMEIVERYSKAKNKNIYKVVIACSSEAIASRISSSGDYKGAFRLH